jgi:hypothetical protein
MKIIIALALTLIMAPASIDSITELLPPDGTPTGWNRQGETNTYGASDLAILTETPDAYINNGLVTAVEQKYTDGSNTLSVRVFELSDQSNASGAFTAATAGKTVSSDLGNGSVLATDSIMFTSQKYIIHVVSESGSSEAMSQNVAAMAMTIDAYLF